MYTETKNDIVDDMVSSTELFPDDFLNKKMNTSIESIRELFIIWRKAIHCFLNDLLDHHDALVGENACQIRAAALIDFSHDHELRSFLLNISNDIHKLIDFIKAISITKKNEDDSIINFLKENNLIFSFSNKYLMQVKFIIDSYILTLTKEAMPSSNLTLNEKTSFEPIKKIGFVKNKAKTIITSTQKSLSKASCLYIISEATKHYDKDLKNLLAIKHDAHKRSYLPQFLIGKILVNKLLNENIPVLIKVNQCVNNSVFNSFSFYLKANQSKNDFEITKHLSAHLSVGMIFEGSVNYQNMNETKSDFLKRISKVSFMDILLSTFASHPQYSGMLKDLPPPFEEIISNLKMEQSILDIQNKKYKEISNRIEKIQNEQFDYLEKKDLAKKIGTALENPSLIFFNHIYADMIENQIKKTSSVKEFNSLYINSNSFHVDLAEAR